MPDINWKYIDECPPKRREQLMKIERRLVKGPASFEDLADELCLSGEVNNKRYIQRLVKELREDIYNGVNDISRACPKYTLKYVDHSLAFPQVAFNINDRRLLNKVLKLVAFFDGSVPIKQVLRASQTNNQDLSNILKDFSSNIELPISSQIASLLAFFYDVIDRKKLIELRYSRINNGQKLLIAPYYLKRFNNKWYLLGRIYLENPFTWSVISLEEIIGCPNEYNGVLQFIPSSEEELVILKQRINNYYKYVIGYDIQYSSKDTDKISRDLDSQNIVPIPIRIKVTSTAMRFLRANKIHPSQKEDTKNGEISLFVVENSLLYQRILAYGDEIEVLEPISLRETITEIINKMAENYKTNS